SDLRAIMRLALPLLAAVLAAAPAPAASALKVVATTEDLAAIARAVGGDRVKVEAIARGYQDPHFVEAKPSFVIKLHGADLLIAVGRELEVGWLPPLVTQARNAKIQPGGAGYLDASLTARILEIPTGQITRAMGDVHPQGNPHYWLDPRNGRRIAKAVEQKLAAMRPADAPYFAQQYAAFDQRLTAAEKRWDAQLGPYRGTKVVTYHRSWANFVDRFGLDVVGYVEPRPGIPPSPAHTLDLIRAMKAQGVKVILVEPYFDTKTPESIARQTGARVVVMPPSVGGVQQASDYVALFDHDTRVLADALKQALGR
ncbi:MAG TPA: metal ABC transporter substrate-binding protein, partial [Vicinamibacteria bacterium]|nr:metal ABC transporter substrate-binding protein [Vicinamibacteria bacterium]